MSNWFHTRVLQGGGHNKNLTLEVTGVIDSESKPDLLYEAAGTRPVKLASIVWCIEEKAGLRLWWGSTGRLLMPMESRSAVRLEVPISNPEDWDRKLILEPRKVTEQHMFTIILDFDQ